MNRNVLTRKIQNDLKDALKAGEKSRVTALRMMISSLKNAELEEREELTEEKEIAILSGYARKCRESISEYGKGGREDLVEKERAELEIVMSYLPDQLDEDKAIEEIKKVIEETGASGQRDIGKVMGLMMSRFKGRVDGSMVKRIASELLGAG